MTLPFPFSHIPWDMFPALQEGATLFAVEMAVVFLFGWLAGWLRLQKDVQVGYTRKLFHYAVFISAGIVMWASGYGAVMYLGFATLLFLLVSINRGDGHVLYEGIARDDDTPHRTYYIMVPFLATAIGGLAGIYFFGKLAIVGFFVAGWGEAAGEPVGTRWGYHPVALPFFGRTQFTRSLEGSVGVLIASFTASMLALWLTMDWELYSMILVSIPVALTAMFVEFFSPHGSDNFTVQVFSAGAAAWVALIVL